MGLVKKTVNITDQQDAWLKAQIGAGLYGNDSEIIRELIRERQLREQESAVDLEVVRNALIEGERSGVGARGLDAIWREARKRRGKHA